MILKQPSEACLRFFADRGDATVNYAEIALDPPIIYFTSVSR
jgi:hypothetical protein